MVKEIADEKAVEKELEKPFINSLEGPCDYDKALDAALKSMYPKLNRWELSKDARYDMKQGHGFVATVWTSQKSTPGYAHLRCCHNKEKGYYFRQSFAPVMVVHKDEEPKRNWFDENEDIIQKLNKKAIEEGDPSFLIPNMYLQGTPRDVVEELLINKAFSPTFTDEGVNCKTKELIEF